MAEAVVVTCPECEKKFKPKSDVRGKKIKCPFCTNPFVVPGGKAAKPDKGKPDKGRPEAQKKEKAKPEPAKEQAAVAVEEKANEYGEFDNDPNPYDVKHVALVPRCPNCTEEMGAHDNICLACGYNTLTREWGKTEKTMGVTFGRHLKYLLPALGSAVFAVFATLFLIYYCTVGPYVLEKTMFSFLDDESMRMWTTVIVLGWIFGAGGFCFKKFIEKPKPDEIALE